MELDFAARIAAGIFAVGVFVAVDRALRPLSKKWFDYKENKKAAKQQAKQTSEDQPATGVWVRSPYASAIFLDFDGVLHPGYTESLEHLRKFEDVIRAFPHVDIVISSSWRKNATFEYLVSLFSKDIQDRVVGTTIEMTGEHFREAEVLEFVRRFGIKHWIAIDDEASLFSPNCQFLMLTEHSKGLSDNNLFELRNRITQWHTGHLS